MGKCVVSTTPSGSHDDSKGPHQSNKISIPASELTWKKSPGISGTHMLVFKCSPLKTVTPKATVDEAPTVFQPDLKSDQENHCETTTLSPISHECNGIDGNKDTNPVVTQTSENCFVKKGTNGISLHDNHRSTLNGCTTTFTHMNRKGYPENDKEMESYKLFKKLKKSYHKKKKPRRTALDLLIAESKQFRNSNQHFSEDESSRDSFADDSTLDDEDDVIELTNNFMVDHSYAKATNGEWEPPSKRPRMMTELGAPEKMLKGVCSAELVVFDSRNKCLLQDGQYELVLQDCDTPSSPPVGSPLSWDTIFGNNLVSIHQLALYIKPPIIIVISATEESY